MNTPPPRRIFSIRNRIVVPYLIITILVASVGTYIVTRLVAGSLQERLSNQLVESGRVSADGVVRIENRHLETLRLVSFSSGLDTAIQDRDLNLLHIVVDSLSTNSGISDAAVLDAKGKPLVTRGSLEQQPVDYANLPIVQDALNLREDNRGDKYGDVLYTLDTPLFALVAPVVQADDPQKLSGVVLVGTPLQEVLAAIKREALADIVLYNLQGQILGSTFVLEAQDINELSQSEVQVQDELTLINEHQESTTHERTIRGHRYQSIYVPFQMRGQTVGLMAVFLPSDFIVIEGGTSAQIFATFFGVAALLIILIGVLIAGTIVRPVQKLVSTAQTVTKGDLTRRSGIKSGDEIGFLGFTFDMMTERLAERTLQLEAEAAQLSAILETSQTGMVMFNPEQNLVFLNQSALSFLNSSGKADALTGIAGLLLNLNPHDRLEIDKFILATQTTTVIHESGEKIGTLVALNDITQQELANQLKDHFITRVSHELRTPLTNIKGFSDLILAYIERNKPPKMEYAEGILMQAKSLDKMITELLNISQMSAGTFSIRRERLDLSQVLLTAIEAERQAIEAAQLKLTVKPLLEECWVWGDAQRLQWAFHHLLDNSTKYSLAGGMITCDLSSELEGWATLQFSDQGVGIRPIEQEYVFDAYYRREVVTHDGQVIDPRGMGLGLYIVRNVIQAHGGQVKLESIWGQGTTVTLLIPTI